MKDTILLLRTQGKSYREIEKIVGCSRSLISYYVNSNGKQSMLDRQTRNRFARRTKYKMLLGGKCQRCGYHKCLDALHFHHKNPSEKKFEIADSIFCRKTKGLSEQDIIDEINKCELVCANCHHELHSTNIFVVV
jgi:hypothetical protein